MQWVTVQKLAELTGLTDKSIYNNIYRNIWIEGKHYKKRRRRIYLNIPAIIEWIVE